MTIDAKQLLDWAAQGVVSDISLADGQFQNLDLSDVQFVRVDASRADFSGSNFANSWWDQCRLRGTVFTGADFGRATLQSCDLQDARLPQQLGPVLLSHCQLAGLNAAGAQWRQVQVRESNLPSVNFQAATFTQCAFDLCQMPDADFSQALGPYLSFWHSSLPRARFLDAHMPGAIFDRAQLHEARFDRATMPQSRWVACVATGAVFSQADLSMGDASHMQAAGCDFSLANVNLLNSHAAQFDAVDWRGCDHGSMRGTDPILLAAENWQPDSRWERP